MIKSIQAMTRKDFEAVPYRGQFNTDIGIFHGLVILPSRRVHDSGYRVMDFVAVRDCKPVARLSGCSDVLHIQGIGGGRFYDSPVEPFPGWSIDCLPKSGLLHLFCFSKNITCGPALSSFEIFSLALVPKEGVKA